MRATAVGRPPRTGRPVLALSLFLLLTSAPGVAQPGSGQVEVRVTDHRAGIADFTTLHVELAEVSLHRRGQPRGAGWVLALQGAPPTDVVPLKQGRWVALGTEHVPTGRYDAVRVRFGAIRGELTRGGVGNMVPDASIVAIDLDVTPGGQYALLIDLYVEDQSDHRPGLYAVKIQEVRIASP